MLAIRITVTIAQIHSAARTQNTQAHKDTHIGIGKNKTVSSSDRMGAFPTLG